ncbi:MAG: glutamate 5-kinase [Candidatus Omnitrophica bacterium]|nr:glutamate 5-kinase [Candidatus Omnitrophota bacterium]
MSKRNVKRITVKIGTRVLTDERNRIDRGVLGDITGQVTDLMDRGIEVILVSSGAIGAGLGLIEERKKTRSLSELQAIASIGQNHLMDIYNEYLVKKGYIAGQILLTQEDFNDRKRFLNIRYTLNTLFQYKAVPVINENDSVSTEEIKCGDNDRLSSLVADISKSDLFIVLTDVEGLYDLKGKKIDRVTAVTGDIKTLCRGKGCEESTGGMLTKLRAVRTAANAGIPGVIAPGRKKNVIVDIVDGKGIGTSFEAHKVPLRARKRWIAFSKKPRGDIMIDEGAEKAIVMRNKSLLSSGVTGAEGRFSDGDVVNLKASSGAIIARGLSNYTSDEISRIKGRKSGQIEEILGYKDYDEVIHRDNLVLLDEDDH